MFTLTDGRDYLYQWDINRSVRVSDPSVTEVHFCNRTGDCSLVTKVYANPTDSELYADIPNILLQSPFDIRVFAYCDCYTKVEETFKVKARTKPDDYVYTETEVLQYSTLSARMDNLEDNIAEEVVKVIENSDSVYSKAQVDDKLENKLDAYNGEYTENWMVALSDGTAYRIYVPMEAPAKSVENSVNKKTLALRDDGQLRVPTTPTKDYHATSKAYVDKAIQEYELYVDDAISNIPQPNLSIYATKQEVDTSMGSLSQEMYLITDALESSINACATKEYVDGLFAGIATAEERSY